ncbi:MAG: argininosuccinate lyase [Rhodospirillales bacterium]|nr:argininosuccinate lyase [Rhodospirillales bacterium]
MNHPGEVSIRERVKEPPSPALMASYYAPALARALDQHFHLENWVHLAHARMLAARGIIAPGDARAIVDAILAIDAAGAAALPTDGTAEDLYSYFERALIARLGPAIGGRLHTGRSRNDLHVTTWRMTLRGKMLGVLAALAEFRAAVLDQAAAQAATVMPGYTHWQHAQPITLGYYLLAFADGLARDHARCAAALAHTDLCPLGAGALATTAFPLDRTMVAAALGFPALVENAYDAVANRDDAAEQAGALAILMTGISRLAVDLQAWSTFEYGFIELADRHSAVSSIMPQKKNPSVLEHAKAQAAMVTGWLGATLACAKNTAFADVSDGVTALNDPVVQALDATRRVLVLMAETVAALRVRPARMADFAARGFGTATELADVIVRETGLSFRMAHNIVAVVVAEAIEAGRSAETITAAALIAAGETLFGQRLALDPAVIAAALDPAETIRRRAVTGGPAPASMAAMLATRQTALAEDRAGAAAYAARLEAARAAAFSPGL